MSETKDFNIKKYIKEALEDQHYIDYEITLNQTGEKSDGYVADITFATVLATTAQGVKDTIHIAVKSSKQGFLQTNRNSYQRETYVYKTILPEFTRYQGKNNIKNVFSSVPKCYKTISDRNMEAIVMEDLVKNGYHLYDRKKPLDLHHLKLVLREYGKFHAISFALRDKNKENFEKLVSNYDDVVFGFLTESFRKTIQQCLEMVTNIFKEMGLTKLYNVCKKLWEKGGDVALIEILKTVEPESAILHGDGWNNNFLYKYEDKEHKVPIKLAIVDWQVSRLHSPVLDLSFLIYSTCSEEELEHFDELLDTYYTSFSTFLTDLGCDPTKLFPFSSLQRHWKKYSLQGVILLTTFLHMTLCDKKDAPVLEGIDDFGEKIMNVHISDKEQYRKRLVAVINHYSNYNFD